MQPVMIVSGIVLVVSLIILFIGRRLHRLVLYSVGVGIHRTHTVHMYTAKHLCNGGPSWYKSFFMMEVE